MRIAGVNGKEGKRVKGKNNIEGKGEREVTKEYLRER